MKKDKKIYQAYVVVKEKCNILGKDTKITLTDDIGEDNPKQCTYIHIELDSAQPLITTAFEKGRYFKVEISPIEDYSFDDIKEDDNG